MRLKAWFGFLAVTAAFVMLAYITQNQPSTPVGPAQDPAVIQAPSAPAPTVPPPRAPVVDSSAWLACREFRALNRDADILTNAEFRARLQQLEARARYSETPGMAETARRMLTVTTRGGLVDKTDIAFLHSICARATP